MSAATAKINLALVVGPRRDDGKHEVATVLERLGLADDVRVERVPHASRVVVTGFEEDTIVRRALQLLLAASGGEVGSLAAAIDKRVPVAGGLGGGSSDAAAALVEGNAQLERPLARDELVAIARTLGADVPFFLADGPQLGTGDGSTLAPLALPRDYHVVLWLPAGASKASTAAVYAAFDERRGARGYAERRTALERALARVQVAEDLAALPPNDLAASPLTVELERRGAFRADVSGAGPILYGLFSEEETADRAARSLAASGRTWVTAPAS